MYPPDIDLVVEQRVIPGFPEILKPPPVNTSVETSEAYFLLRHPNNYGGILDQRPRPEQIALTAVRRFLAACRLQAGREGWESLGSITKLWNRFPEILAGGDEKLASFRQDEKLAYYMAYLMTEAPKVFSSIRPSALVFFLERNPVFGSNVTPLQYRVDIAAAKLPGITYSGLIDSVGRFRTRDGRLETVATVIEMDNSKDGRGAAAFEMYLAKLGCKCSIIGGLPVRVRVWGVLSKNCYELRECDEEMALDLARKTAMIMKKGCNPDVIRQEVIHFSTTCMWSRVRLT